MIGKPAPKKVERYFYCPFYDECLDLAACGNWISFSCDACPIYKNRVEFTQYFQKKYRIFDDDGAEDI